MHYFIDNNLINLNKGGLVRFISFDEIGINPKAGSVLRNFCDYLLLKAKSFKWYHGEACLMDTDPSDVASMIKQDFFV